MKYLDETYTPIITYKGKNICTLKIAVPTKGDNLEFKIDDEKFKDMVFEHPEDAMKVIDSLSDSENYVK